MCSSKSALNRKNDLGKGLDSHFDYLRAAKPRRAKLQRVQLVTPRTLYSSDVIISYCLFPSSTASSGDVSRKITPMRDGKNESIILQLWTKCRATVSSMLDTFWTMISCRNRISPSFGSITKRPLFSPQLIRLEKSKTSNRLSSGTSTGRHPSICKNSVSSRRLKLKSIRTCLSGIWAVNPSPSPVECTTKPFSIRCSRSDEMVAEVGIPKVLEVPILPVIPNHATHTVEGAACGDSLSPVMW